MKRIADFVVFFLFLAFPLSASSLFDQAKDVDKRQLPFYRVHSSYENIYNVVSTPENKELLWWPYYSTEMEEPLLKGFLDFWGSCSFTWTRICDYAGACAVQGRNQDAFWAYAVLYDLAGIEDAQTKAETLLKIHPEITLALHLHHLCLEE